MTEPKSLEELRIEQAAIVQDEFWTVEDPEQYPAALPTQHSALLKDVLVEQRVTNILLGELLAELRRQR